MFLPHLNPPGTEVPNALCQEPSAEVIGAWCQVPGAWCQIPNALCQWPEWCQVQDAWCQVQGAQVPKGLVIAGGYSLSADWGLSASVETIPPLACRIPPLPSGEFLSGCATAVRIV